MPSVGPPLPPHLAKRKRDEDGASSEPSPRGSSSPESGDKRRRVAGPAAPPPNIGPSLPPIESLSRSRSSSEDSDIGPAPPDPSKPSETPRSIRVMGPAPPPVPLSERPPNPPPDDSDSSSDEFGPAPPATGARYTYNNDEGPTPQSAFDAEPQYAEQANKVQRDDWMTMPPTQDDLAARMDPSKMRARKFNTGKSAGSGGRGGGMGIWTETPEQKLKRLQNEALGVSAPANSSESAHIDGRRSKEEERQARKIREKIDATRGKSLMEQHRENGSGKGKDDDPSKRGFDWEKDMGGGMKIGHKQRQEMLNKAKGFGDRFSSGSFL